MKYLVERHRHFPKIWLQIDWLTATAVQLVRTVCRINSLHFQCILSSRFPDNIDEICHLETQQQLHFLASSMTRI